MALSVEAAQVQWLEQLAAMRKAIAELNLPVAVQSQPAYGSEIPYDEDEFSGTASGDDIWDIISDEYEEDYSSDQLDQVVEGESASSVYNQHWLANQCAKVARNGSGLDGDALKDQIMAILSSDSNGRISSPLLHAAHAYFR